MLSALKISHKLALMVVVAISAFVVSEGFTILAERENSSRLGEVGQTLYPTLELSTVNLGQLSLIELQINSAVATGDDAQLDATRPYYETIKDNLEELDTLNPDDSDQTDALSGQITEYYSTATRIATSIIDGSADFARIGDEAAANAQRLQDLRADMTKMREQTRTQFTQSISETVEASRSATNVGITILVATTLLLIALSLLIGRSISRSLGQIINSLKAMASGEGDLTSRLDYSGKDELREVVTHFNAFVEKLHVSFGAISKDVSGLNTVSLKLGASSNQNLERIQDQSEAILAARHAVDELVKSVEEVAGFASSASDQTQDASNFAEQGYNTVSTNIETIRALACDVEETAGLVNQFEQFSAKVGGLLDTIQTVADQTNLLALNAAIEAARAGEHGRGFAVVADEVRGLAVRTRSATEEIHTVINELTNVSGSAVKSMQQSVTKAREGVGATTQSGEMLKKILENMQSINTISDQIAAATYEQSATFNSVTQHITDIHNNAEHVSSSTRELDSVSKDIREISDGLNAVAGQFKV